MKDPLGQSLFGIGESRQPAILTGYFVKHQEAQEAFESLRRRGHRRLAWISRDGLGKISRGAPFFRRWIGGVIGTSLLAGALGALLSAFLLWPGLASAASGAVIGALLGTAWIRRSRFGVEQEVLEGHARRLMPGETVLILQAPIERLRPVMALLLESGGEPPAVFVLNPERKGPEPARGDQLLGNSPLDSVELPEHARRLAMSHRLDATPLEGLDLLERLEEGRRWVQRICLDLSEASHLLQNLPSASEWLLDNEHLLERSARDVALNLPRRYYRQLPTLASDPDRGLPRIYSLARELTASSDLHLDRENVLVFTKAYQSENPLLIGELWALPQILRMVLIEGIERIADQALTELREQESAAIWANRLISANRGDPSQLFPIMAELTQTFPSPSSHFAFQLIDSLYDEGEALAPVRNWLGQVTHQSLDNLVIREKKRQTMNQISIGNAFGSLRTLSLIDWRECFEELSQVEATLRRDPAGLYPQMDFATRDRYRQAVEELHRGGDLEEVAIAQRALELAARGRLEEGPEASDHVGTYLIGERRRELAWLSGCRESRRFRALRWVRANHWAVYFLGLTLPTAALVLLALWLASPTGLGAQVALVALFLLPSSQIAVELINALIMGLIPARSLPKMDFSVSGIPDALRTLVVVPTLLVDDETIRAEAEKLEIRFLANRESNLLFALYPDYLDSDSAHDDADEALLKKATECVEALERRHGPGRFFLLLRERKWSDSEQKFIGWERKRGKLEELNDLIAGTRPPDAEKLVYVGKAGRLCDVKFIITLDSDTLLPPGSARRMVETLAHPLNRARLDEEGRVQSGYTLIQPRVSPSLPSAGGSPFSRLFSDPVGIDPYTNVVSDVYQDLTGAGSYYGKGIYDVETFSHILSGRFPEALLLSHDLIEGAHVRVGLASDIELFDDFPQDYQSYARRQHRWIRGDWQIARWVLPGVPLADGGRGPNPLRPFDRWKILDNLRRSLLAPANLALLTMTWLLFPEARGVAAAVVAVQLLFHSLIQPFSWAITGGRFKGISLAKDLLRGVVEAALLPHQACLALDAIVRVGYRRAISHRKLLEWSSAQGQRNRSWKFMFRLYLVVSGAFGLLAGSALVLTGPEALPSAAPWLLLWLVSPLIGLTLNRRPSTESPQELISGEDRHFLRLVARRTWRYFSDLVNEESSWLPPDNYQTSYRRGAAMRTSPTNIALHLVSVLSAHDFGYLTAEGVAQRLAPTMATIKRMERYEGHLFNWYDIETREPLEPRYVSSVDSGNLLGALWTLEQGLQALLTEPLLDRRAFAGLHDAGEILRQALGKGKRADPLDVGALAGLLRSWNSPPSSVTAQLKLLRETEDGFRLLSSKGLGDALGGPTERAYWAKELERQLSEWLSIADSYLLWVEILAERTEEEIAVLDPEALPTFRQLLRHGPSLKELADEDNAFRRLLHGLRQKMAVREDPALEWVERTLAALGRAEQMAGEMAASIEGLARESHEFSESMNMKFLYNAERHLFSIGFNVSESRLDRSFYDLLASEARLGSFVAIARGDVPTDHWFAMGRPYGAIGRRRTLLSWSGTMFEYLMPLLFQRSYDRTLLDKAAGEAVKIQIDFGRKHRLPWGISESAFGDLDIHKTYQYKAFGVPQLGLKRDLAEKIVVAPYATFLAMAFEPRAALHNLRRLAKLGLLGDYGYYESMDFSRTSSQGAAPGVVVHAYMAHHQGMIFLALNNFLHDNRLQGLFHANLKVRTVEPLLHERIPDLPPLHYISTRERASSVPGAGEVAPAVSQFDTPHTATPRVQLLSNGRYGLMVTAAGGGYSRWNGLDITRWQSDRTRDSWGTFCYLRDVDSDHLWCNSYHPTRGEAGSSYQANFTLDRALFRRVDEDIESTTEILVATEDDVEIRRITLINRSSQRRQIELTSYIELALAPHEADRIHRAFNKLFIQTEALPKERALIAWRRPRHDDESPLYVAHRLTLGERAGEADDGPLLFETDRRQFIGRGHTLADPMGARQELGGSQGFVLDPILSLRQGLTLRPGQRKQVSLILAAGSSREEVTRLVNKFGEPQTIDRTIDSAWVSVQLNLRLLRIQPDEARRFQQMAGHMLYPNPLLRSAGQHIADNRKGQAGLWAYSLSGDLPIALVSIDKTQDLSLIRQMFQAHAYWRMHGLAVDLVLLNEEPGGYNQPLRDDIEHLIQTYGTGPGADQPGGTHLLMAGQIPAEDLTLLRAVASVSLVAAQGSLPQQMATMTSDRPVLPEIQKRETSGRDPSGPLPFMELPFFNSLGGFTADGREYVIYLGPGTDTPAPWSNVIANPTFGTLVTERGSGFTWQGNSQRNRLTPWSNDPVLDPSSEAIYIRDEETGDHWTPTASPIREESAYRARHGAGYTVFEHNSNGIDQELTVFVPVDEAGGEPIKLQKLALTNESGRPRSLSVTYYVEWVLGETREASQMHVVTGWDNEAQAMVARNFYHPDYSNRVAFVAISTPTRSYTGDRTTFVGRNRSLEDPAAMGYSRLSLVTGAGMDPCAAVQSVLKLAPGERLELICMLGQTQTVKEVRSLVGTYREGLAVERALERSQAWWDGLLGTIQVRTPEETADLLINRWLLYQSLSCRIWGRSGFYQSSGAFGFRDQLQDVMALLYSKPQLAREHILRAAGRQFREGDVQHWWHPPSGEGIRSRISDDLLWLPFVTAQYVRITADRTVLDEVVPFIDAPLLLEDQQECFQRPGPSSESATLFEHCLRALDHSRKFGANGLPLIGSGDWNDGMNRVGAGGKGESVWMGWFMAEILERMAELSDLVGQPALTRSYRREREVLIGNIERFAWDGEWYLRATSDEGLPVGSHLSEEGQIFSLPQSWAWISGAAKGDRAQRALDSAWERLVRKDKDIVLLFEPPFDRSIPSPGYIKGYPPGVRENGGQYTHGATWLAIAMARSGDGTRAAQILRMLNPIEHTGDPKSLWLYGVEPYAVAADIYSLPEQAGRGGWSWYTGAAAWVYRAWVEEVLGLKVRGDTLELNPVIPASWDGFQMTYRHGEATYEIEVENPDHRERGVASVELDGTHVEKGLVKLVRDPSRHHVLVRMGEPQGTT